MLETSIYSFSYDVFKSLLFQGHDKAKVHSKGLNVTAALPILTFPS